ncbi:ly6/PLAUR domain-containing protein 1 [Lithobates pipiens]
MVSGDLAGADVGAGDARSGGEERRPPGIRRGEETPGDTMWMQLMCAACCCWGLLGAGLALQIQCYQCEEFQRDDCSSPEFIVNCTVNVQDTCQKEVMEKSDGILYRKSCASSAACLIASAGYQSFCTPGKVNSVCISCCDTSLCNGPRTKRNRSAALMHHGSSPAILVSLVVGLLTKQL